MGAPWPDVNVDVDCDRAVSSLERVNLDWAYNRCGSRSAVTISPRVGFLPSMDAQVLLKTPRKGKLGFTVSARETFLLSMCVQVGFETVRQ